MVKFYIPVLKWVTSKRYSMMPTASKYGKPVSKNYFFQKQT